MNEENRKAMIGGLINNVVSAIDNLVSASIAKAKQDDEWDDMGTYYEEVAMNEAVTELVNAILERP